MKLKKGGNNKNKKESGMGGKKSVNLKRDLYRACHAAIACGAVMVSGYSRSRKRRRGNSAGEKDNDDGGDDGSAAEPEDADRVKEALRVLNDLLQQRSAQREFHARKELRRSVKKARDLEVAKAIRAGKKSGGGGSEAEAVTALKAADLDALTDTVATRVGERCRAEISNAGAGEPNHTSIARAVASDFPRGTPGRRVSAHASVVEAAAALSQAIYEAEGAPLPERVRAIVAADTTADTAAGGGTGDGEGSGSEAFDAGGGVFLGGDVVDGIDAEDDDAEAARMRELESIWDAELEGANVAGLGGKSKKNRPGQMARRKRAEQKHGEEARHVRDPELRQQMEAREEKRKLKGKGKGRGAGKGRGGAVKMTAYGPARPAMPRGGANLIQVGSRDGRPVASTFSAAASKETDGELHPSWIAKRQQMEAAKSGFQGTKVTFDDD